MVGKRIKKSSNHWKNTKKIFQSLEEIDLFFQPLEESHPKSSNHWKNIKKNFQSLEIFMTPTALFFRGREHIFNDIENTLLPLARQLTDVVEKATSFTSGSSLASSLSVFIEERFD